MNKQAISRSLGVSLGLLSLLACCALICASSLYASESNSMPVPALTIYPGDTIKDAWIVERDFPTNFSSNSSQAHSAFITERGAIIGKIARRTLLPGAPIPSNAVAEPKVVLNGAKVKLIFKEGGLMIMTYGAALQAGGSRSTGKLHGDVFPNRIPPNAFLYALDAPEPNAAGELKMAIGSYGYMTFDLWAEDIEQTSVPAGTFQTLKVIARVDTESAMRGWPVFLTHLAQPFMPKDILYYDVSPPHHLVKFVGSLGYLAPDVTVEMNRVYIAPESVSRGVFGASHEPR